MRPTVGRTFYLRVIAPSVSAYRRAYLFPVHHAQLAHLALPLPARPGKPLPIVSAEESGKYRNDEGLQRHGKNRAREDSNPQPADPKSAALSN